MRKLLLSLALMPTLGWAEIATNNGGISTNSSVPSVIAAGPSIIQRMAIFRNQLLVANPFGGSGSLANAQGTADVTNNTMNTREVLIAPIYSDIADIVLAFPGFLQNTGGGSEANIPTGYTVTCSVEYPIGATPRQLFFSGAATGTVTPGRTLLKTDPLPLDIPAGAQFAVKTFLSWTPGTFYLMPVASTAQNTIEWAARGTGLSDQTLTNTVLSSTTNGQGFAPLVYANLYTPIPSIGIVGDSISVGAGDVLDMTTWNTRFGKGMRNKLPIITVGIGGGTMTGYLARQEGTNLILRNAITHLIFELGVNDLSAGQTAAQMETNAQLIWKPFLARGVKVFATTITPHTTSTDGFITAANQTISSGTAEGYRQTYNAWLLANWQSLGLAGVFDVGHVYDPTDSGKWSSDAGLTSANVASGYAYFQSTITGGVVTALNFTSQQGSGSVGNGYVNGTVLNWIAVPYPGETGSGAFGTITVNGSGQALTPAITSGGIGYSAAPMINILGPWTADGLHPTPRGTNQFLGSGIYSPASFVLQ